MPFLAALIEFVFGQTGQIPKDYVNWANAVFAVACTVMALFAVLLDWALYSLRGRSAFDLSYGRSSFATARLIALWGLGAGVGGFLGATSSVLQTTRLAAIGVGVGWPLILPRLIDSFSQSLREPEQRPTDGEK